MRSRNAFPVSATVAEAARHLAQQQRKLLLKHPGAASEDSPDSAPLSLRKSTARLDQPLDPDYEADNSMLVLNPLEVDYYDGNPRVDLGEDYPQLKASIRLQGLNAKLSVTRRPGAARYMVEAGGNRRLRILRELSEEGDERFRNEIFVFRAWKSESTVLLRHLSENIQRAGMTLFEEASGVLRLKRVLEEERGERYSLRRLEEILADIGFPVTKSALSIYAFAAERLAVLGPATKALTVKATRDTLQNGFNRLARLAALFGIEEPALYEACLNPVMESAGRRYAESNVFDHEALYEECEQALANRLHATRPVLRQWLAVLRANPKASRDDLIAPMATAAGASGAAPPGRALTEPIDEARMQTPKTSAGPLAPAASHEAAQEPTGSIESSCIAALPDDGGTASPSRLETALRRFAAAVGAERSLRLDAALPRGFYVEVPQPTGAIGQSGGADFSPDEAQCADDPALLPLDLQHSHGYGNPHLYHGWWLLMQLSGLLSQGDVSDLDDGVLHRLPDESAWRQAAQAGYEELERIFTDTAGPKPDFAFVLDWLTAPGHPLAEALTSLLASLREARQDGHAAR